MTNQGLWSAFQGGRLSAVCLFVSEPCRMIIIESHLPPGPLHVQQRLRRLGLLPLPLPGPALRGPRPLVRGALLAGGAAREPALRGSLKYRIPRLHSRENSQRFPENLGDSCNNKTSFLWVFVENRFLTSAPGGFRRKPEPVPVRKALDL